MCGFASYDLFEKTYNIGYVEQIYSDEEIAIMKERVEALREDQFLEDVYGMKSKLSYKEWHSNVCKNGYWIFDAVEIRKRMLKEA